MREFRDERIAIKEALDKFFYTFVYEKDAGARSQSIHETYTQELTNCDLYIGVFGTGYGEYTIDEFESARKRKISCLIYEKELSEHETRDIELDNFLDHISSVTDKDGLSICRFESIDDLIQNIERDISRWIKSRDKSRTSFKLGMEKKYYCDRDNQSIDFRMADKEEKFNFFIIDGARKQSHINLVKRFSLDKSGTDNVKKTIQIDDKGNIERLKIFIKLQLFEKFDINPIPSELSLESLIENILHDGYEKVFIIFRIEENLLSNANVSEAIRWFSKDYCNENSLPDGSPDFYFFLIVRYNEIGSSKKPIIQRHLKKFNTYVKLDELDNVSTGHVKLWLEQNGIAESETAQDLIIDQYFEDNSYPMELAESKIAKLIFDYNNKNQELIDLINNY